MSQTIIFQVYYLGNCGCGDEEITRKIELEDTDSLDDLHKTIIFKAFKWDEAHMYSFFMDNKPYSKNHNMEYSNDSGIFNENAAKSSNIKLKDLGLKSNQKFLFVFDFGDDHHFGIKVEEFGEVESGKKYPLILEEKGEAPPQYPDSEDEEEDDE